MKKLLMAFAAVPFMAGLAAAGPSNGHVTGVNLGHQLSEAQMDRVTAGFTALSIADAEGLVGESGIVLTTTASLSQVLPIARATMGETSSNLYKSVAAAQSSTVTSTYNPASIPGLNAEQP